MVSTIEKLSLSPETKAVGETTQQGCSEGFEDFGRGRVAAVSGDSSYCTPPKRIEHLGF